MGRLQDSIRRSDHGLGNIGMTEDDRVVDCGLPSKPARSKLDCRAKLESLVDRSGVEFR